jgi:hypothetical protein
MLSEGSAVLLSRHGASLASKPESFGFGRTFTDMTACPLTGHADTPAQARICAHATALVRAVPKSRWTHTESEFWEFSAIAGHSRSIIEGRLLLFYIIKEPKSPEEWSARVNIMHLNDSSRRIKILESVIDPAESAAFSARAEEYRDRLRGNPWFSGLDQNLQKRLLSGDALTITTRDDQIAEIGWDKKHFYMMWNLLSQYTHILPLSFYRMEPNGRGTGIENDFDRAYIYMMLRMGTDILADCTNRMVEAFPDTAWARNGVESKFSPGPSRNRPRERHRG